MATNKHATIRYHALDKCFSNTGRRYYIEDLIDACNQAIYDYSGISDGIKRRQIFEDIKFMESEAGWSVPLDRIKDGKRVYYRYSDSHYSIKKQAINQLEAEQLKETLSILTRFKGMPQFEWIDELTVRIENTFKLGAASGAFVGFEQNPYLKGLHYFTEIFNAIQNKKVLSIIYQGFKQKESTEVVLHPWYLKQYNNRWFLFGYNNQYQNLTNMALDRILELSETSFPYIENTEIDFDEFFEDVVGVTVKEKVIPQKILIEVTHELWPYIESKPIHGTQKVKSRNDEYTTIELKVQVNHELISCLFGYMDGIEIKEPSELRNLMKINLENTLKRYF